MNKIPPTGGGVFPWHMVYRCSNQIPTLVGGLPFLNPDFADPYNQFNLKIAHKAISPSLYLRHL
jgi:hypothetical protein